MSDLFAKTELGERYGRALFDLALDSGAQDSVARDLTQLGVALGVSADLRRLVIMVGLPVADKLKGLLGIADKLGFNPLTCKALGVLAQNNRLEAIYGFIGAYKAIYEAHHGRADALVTTAVPMTEAQLGALKTALSDALGREPGIRTEVVPDILGGLKVQLGSRLFDASLKTKLDTLSHSLKRA